MRCVAVVATVRGANRSSNVLRAAARVQTWTSRCTPSWSAEERGQSFAEYALIFTLVVVVAAVGLSTFGTGLGAAVANTVGSIIALM